MATDHKGDSRAVVRKSRGDERGDGARGVRESHPERGERSVKEPRIGGQRLPMIADACPLAKQKPKATAKHIRSG